MLSSTSDVDGIFRGGGRMMSVLDIGHFRYQLFNQIA